MGPHDVEQEVCEIIRQVPRDSCMLFEEGCLHACCRLPAPATAQRLLEMGVSPWATTSQSRDTPLSVAYQNGCFDEMLPVFARAAPRLLCGEQDGKHTSAQRSCRRTQDERPKVVEIDSFWA